MIRRAGDLLAWSLLIALGMAAKYYRRACPLCGRLRERSKADVGY